MMIGESVAEKKIKLFLADDEKRLDVAQSLHHALNFATAHQK